VIYTCRQCDLDLPGAREAAKHARQHDVAEFTREATCRAVPAWEVGCSGTCGTDAAYHLVARSNDVYGCTCPAAAHGRQDCRHVLRAKRVGNVLPSPAIADTLARLIEAGRRILAADAQPSLILQRLRHNYAALAAQIEFIRAHSGPTTPATNIAEGQAPAPARVGETSGGDGRRAPATTTEDDVREGIRAMLRAGQFPVRDDTEPRRISDAARERAESMEV